MIPDGPPRILMADDHTLVAEAVKSLLVPQFTIVGVVADGRALVESALKLEPDVVLSDIALPRLNGLDAAQRIAEKMPWVTILFLTMISDSDVITEAMQRGAVAVVSKTAAHSELVHVIHDALSRRSRLRPATSPSPRSSAAEELRVLTNRERDVLQLLAEGLSMKEVASVLHLTMRTIAFHKYRIMQALGARNDADLVQSAIRGHLLFLQPQIETHATAYNRAK